MTLFRTLIFFLLLLVGSSAVALAQVGLKLSYLGTAGWEITDGKTVVLVDPYLTRLKSNTPNDPVQSDCCGHSAIPVSYCPLTGIASMFRTTFRATRPRETSVLYRRDEGGVSAHRSGCADIL